jgi:short-subunit dehydrogenase
MKKRSTKSRGNGRAEAARRNGHAHARQARRRAHPSDRRARRRGTALITGASSGIGAELSRVFARNGFDLVLVARRKEALAALSSELERDCGVRATVIASDLTAGDAPAKLFAAVRRRGIAVDVLVNNAGVAVFDRFVRNTPDDQMGLLRLNVVAVAALTRLFVAPMVARRRGRILNVASVAAFQPTPWLALYGASKAFVLSLTESLAVELEGTGVTATALCPGFTDTPLVTSAERKLHKPGLVPSIFMLDATAVAKEGYDACMAGRTICINGLPYEVVVQWAHLWPRWVVRTVGGMLGRRFEPSGRA